MTMASATGSTRQFLSAKNATSFLNSLTKAATDGKALASVYVSYFEGFGIPIAEAYKCDVPVITSNVTSMPEVAGDAALLVNPFDIESIAGALELVMDENVRNSLIEKGRVRREDFSWDKTAEQWWAVIAAEMNNIKDANHGIAKNKINSNSKIQTI